MKYVRILFAVALVFMVCSAFSFKKGKVEKVVLLPLSMTQ